MTHHGQSSPQKAESCSTFGVPPHSVGSRLLLAAAAPNLAPTQQTILVPTESPSMVLLVLIFIRVETRVVALELHRAIKLLLAQPWKSMPQQYTC